MALSVLSIGARALAGAFGREAPELRSVTARGRALWSRVAVAMVVVAVVGVALAVVATLGGVGLIRSGPWQASDPDTFFQRPV